MPSERESREPLSISLSRREFLGLFGAGTFLALLKSTGGDYLSTFSSVRNVDARFEQKALSPELEALRQRLSEEISSYPGETSISICNVLTGETIDVNGNRPQLPGCVANLPCALTAIAELASGKAKYTREQIEPIMTTMVRYSNPTAGKELVNIIGNGSLAVGVAKINYLMKAWGMQSSFYDHPPAYGSSYSVRGDSNWLVANEMSNVLAKIAENKLFPIQDYNWNIYALWAMSNNKPGLNFMIPGEIPESEALVVHKVGWYPGNPYTINDSAVVAAWDGRFVYVICAMHQNYNNSLDEQSLFYGPGFFIRKLSSITYETMTSKYGEPFTYNVQSLLSKEPVPLNLKTLDQA